MVSCAVDTASNHKGRPSCYSVTPVPIIQSVVHSTKISYPSSPLAVVQAHVQARQNNTHFLLAIYVCQQMYIAALSELRFSRCIRSFGYVIPHVKTPSFLKQAFEPWNHILSKKRHPVHFKDKVFLSETLNHLFTAVNY